MAEKSSGKHLLAAASLGLLLSSAALATTCVAYPAGPTMLQVSGRPLALTVARELEPCIGVVTQGNMVVVMRGADGLTKTREFGTGDAFDAGTLGVAKPGKLITAVLTGSFFARLGSSRGPLENPESWGLPVGDILLPTQPLAIGEGQDLLAAGYSELRFYGLGNDKAILLLPIASGKPASVPVGLFKPGMAYSWTLGGASGVQSGVFQTISTNRQQTVLASLDPADSTGLASQLKNISLLMDAELTFDAVQRRAALPR